MNQDSVHESKSIVLRNGYINFLDASIHIMFFAYNQARRTYLESSKDPDQIQYHSPHFLTEIERWREELNKTLREADEVELFKLKFKRLMQLRKSGAEVEDEIAALKLELDTYIQDQMELAEQEYLNPKLLWSESIGLALLRKYCPSYVTKFMRSLDCSQ